jgi:hypothetical protein
MAIEPLNLRPYHRQLVLWTLHNAADAISASEIVDWAGEIALRDGKESLDGWQGPRVGGLLKELKGQGIVTDQYRHNPRSGRSEPAWKLIGAQDPDMPFPKAPTAAELQAAAKAEQLVGPEEFEALAEAAVRAQASLETMGAALGAVREELAGLRTRMSKALAKSRAGGTA